MYMAGLIAQHNILLQLTPTDLCHRALYKDIFTTHEQNMNPARPQAYSYILKHREQLLLVCDSETVASLVDHLVWTLQPKTLKATTHSLVQESVDPARFVAVPQCHDRRRTYAALEK